MDKIKLTPLVICRKPYTVILVSSKLSEKEKQKKILKYIDRKGNLKIETVPEYSIYD